MGGKVGSLRKDSFIVEIKSFYNRIKFICSFRLLLRAFQLEETRILKRARATVMMKEIKRDFYDEGWDDERKGFWRMEQKRANSPVM